RHPGHRPDRRPRRHARQPPGGRDLWLPQPEGAPPMTVPPAEETMEKTSTPVDGVGEASSVAPIATKRPGALGDFIRRVRGNRSAVVALAVLLSLTFLAIIAPWIT